MASVGTIAALATIVSALIGLIAFLRSLRRARLQIEIRQLCQNQTLDSITADLSDFTVDIYVFLYVWAVNKSSVKVTAKSWNLEFVGKGERVTGKHVPRITPFYQHVKWNEEQHGMRVEKSERRTLVAFRDAPLEPGVPLEGWICFNISGAKHTFVDKAEVKLTLIDSLGKRHRVKQHGPWRCDGDIVNPDKPF